MGVASGACQPAITHGHFATCGFSGHDDSHRARVLVPYGLSAAYAGLQTAAGQGVGVGTGREGDRVGVGVRVGGVGRAGGRVTAEPPPAPASGALDAST